MPHVRVRFCKNKINLLQLTNNTNRPTFRGVLLENETLTLPQLSRTLYVEAMSCLARSTPYLQFLVGPPMLTISNGLGKGASSSCQAIAARRSAAESAWCSAPTHTTFLPGGSCGVIHLRNRRGISSCPPAIKA
ncbi:Os02g0535801 [Oryza sativa Japonica Group]|uniref:Os02g0535801 protein n=1 Tax=Oryza sativa subsp. japonica TaxID=39947 RepID=A0A0P0VK14_ORYSJ|nr:Os02g0535801 [Oryza sativa Japonica Group]